MTDTTSTDRWGRISKLYGEALHRSSDLRFQTFQIARVVGDRVLESLQCREDAINYYAYTVSEDAPRWDTFEKVNNPFDAVLMNGSNWTFGLGFTIEKAENTFPKNTLVVPITASFNDNEITVSSPISSTPHRLIIDQPTDAEVDAFVEDLLDGLEKVVERWARGEPKTAKIGFRTITE